ncbi:hypothetical protein QKU48_gp0907 [Fadolivirus algeromassiliense]|jgi:hypothetical protein|uniref:Uncharacterized protein n=1 Tax=Fadolivirus FV1/VV64 TaxID=3070911 RepID=A0A7D3QUR2_9VIRU|nr:hypothetical protein QKU48_gp0907 [Fadolivirus algeromassiliense]QKF94365.1 hypothetical protein Fadolivirus_1_907 [Fadolivirus FV1/VV64]
MRPSFLSHALNGLTLFLAVILFAMNYNQFNTETMIKMLLFISIAIGIHGLLHHKEEIYYGWNPLAGKWKISDDKI